MVSSHRKQHIESIVESMHTIKRGLVACSVGVTASQWAVLAVITRKGSVGVKEIAATLGITSSAATQLIDELVKNGYVLRSGDTNDRRALLLELSPTCKEHMKGMRQKRMERFRAMFAKLSDTELEQFALLNKKLAENILETK